MTTQWLDAAPVDETLERAGKVRFSRVLATGIFGVCFIIGWVLGRLWVGAVFCALAVSEGWREGSQPGQLKRPPRQE